jgi:methylthioribulose-1-phosphate dehydratase
MIEFGRAFCARNWILGRAGNFSAVVSRQPFELAITKSGVDRGGLTSSDFVHLDKSGQSLDAGLSPSLETPIHWTIISETGADAVLQTHSVWSTVLADVYAAAGEFELKGFEVLKGLSGVVNSQHSEWVPIVENSEDYLALAGTILRVLKARPEIHAILVRRHGLYTWGATVEEAVRHVEIFELLFEVLVRQLHIFAQLEPKGGHDLRN